MIPRASPQPRRRTSPKDDNAKTVMKPERPVDTSEFALQVFTFNVKSAGRALLPFFPNLLKFTKIVCKSLAGYFESKYIHPS